MIFFISMFSTKHLIKEFNSLEKNDLNIEKKINIIFNK
jgi:hypothetical protein